MNVRHNCKNCGAAMCGKHLGRKQFLTHYGYTKKQEICPACSWNLNVMCNEVSRRLGEDVSYDINNWDQQTSCKICAVEFGFFVLKHHCYNCGGSVCNSHSSMKMPLYHRGVEKPVRCCDECYVNLVKGAHDIRSRLRSGKLLTEADLNNSTGSGNSRRSVNTVVEGNIAVAYAVSSIAPPPVNIHASPLYSNWTPPVSPFSNDSAFSPVSVGHAQVHFSPEPQYYQTTSTVTSSSDVSSSN